MEQALRLKQMRKLFIGFCVAALVTGLAMSYAVRTFTECDPHGQMVNLPGYFKCVMERRR